MSVILQKTELTSMAMMNPKTELANNYMLLQRKQKH